MPEHKFEIHRCIPVTADPELGRDNNETPRYLAARTIEEVMELLAEHGREARILAGGLDVVGLLKNDIIHPRVLINIKPVEKLKFMAAADEGLRVGALTRIKEIEQSELVRKNVPMLAAAAGLIGSPHVRSMATAAGNLCQQTRCWYYRRPADTGLVFHCHRKGNPGTCYARDGENQHHSVLGEGVCVSSFPSDLAVVLAALGGKVKIVGPAGVRTTALDQFYSESGPEIGADELITAIHIPMGKTGSRQNYVKFRTRQAIDFAIVSVAVSYEIAGRSVRSPRIVLGGVAPRPYRARAAEEALADSRLTVEAATRAGELAAMECRPLSSNGYKVSLIKTLVRRALLEA